LSDIFLSYSRDDLTIARRFAEGFEREGFSVWWDASLIPGEAFDQVIEKALGEAKAVVVLWSRKSVASRWVRAEATQANDNGTLVPVMIEPCKRPIMFELTHTADLSHWNGERSDKAWQSCVAAVRRLVNVGAATSTAPMIARASRNEPATRARLLGILVAVVIIAGGAIWALHRWAGEYSVSPATVTASTSASTPVSAAPAGSRNSIAVMPFANLTGDASKDYLGDGMAEEVINTLTKVPDLKVPARTSSFAYKGRNIDIRQIARDLNVGAILEGSVRSAGNRIRVTAQLIDAQSGLHRWSQTYDRKFTDLFQLQDDLAIAIVQALQVNLNGASSSSVTQAPPARNVEAYDLYLQGYSAMLQGTEQSLHFALDLYGQALARDPKFARAFAGRSRARLSFLVRGLPLANAREDAERDARQALALDPSLDVAHQALGNVSALRADWLQAESSYQAALSVDTGSPEIHSGYAMVVLAATGRLHQAYLEGDKAYHLAPASPNQLRIISSLSSYLRHDADAVKYADLAATLGPQPSNRPMLQVAVLAAIRGGRFAEAADRVTGSLPPAIRSAGGAEVLRLVYAALADPSKKAAASQALEVLLQRLGVRNSKSVDRRDFIVDFAMLDALDPAYDLASRYLDDFLSSGTGGGVDWDFLWIPEMHSFRQDPRFQGFVTRLNLISYWKQYGPPDGCDLKGGTLLCR
jgi:TolB-like protein/Tfp pilus assembly protein PilF